MGNAPSSNSERTPTLAQGEAEEDPLGPATPTATPSEDTSLLGKLRNGINGLTKPKAATTTASTWSKMPFGNDTKSALDEAAEAVTQSQNNPCPYLNLTYGQRFTAFVICFAVGTLLSVVSTMNVPSIVLRPSRFAIPFTLGNIVSLLSMSFLIGFKRQCSSIFHRDRKITSTIFIISMIGTIVASFFLHSGVLTFGCVVVQYSAYIWYCLSYIPYGRSACLGCGSKIWKCVT